MLFRSTQYSQRVERAALATICAIDRAALSTLCEYWVPEVEVAGVHELIGNALILPGEKKRTTDLRMEPLPGMEDEDE